MRSTPALALPFALCLLGSLARPQGEVIPFSSDRWDVRAGEVVEHLGRESFRGTAFLKDATLADGVLEVDIAMDGRRSYPGVVFRMQSEQEYERFYLRPHRAGLYPDALQYTPVFHGSSPWQLYHGPGHTAGAELAHDRWVRLRIEFGGDRAMVFLDDAFAPSLEIPTLAHGASSGGLGVLCPTDGTAYFSNFRYWPDDELDFPGHTPTPTTPGWLTEWEISGSIPAARVSADVYPSFFALFATEWSRAKAETSGLLNISRLVPRTGPAKETVLARTVLTSDARRRVKLSFGYSDEVTIFHNTRPVFRGDSAYRSRDQSFVGVIGLHDHVYLELEKGRNELFLVLSETFGGWGFMGRFDFVPELPVVRHELTERLWETPRTFLTPESVQYDAARDVLYVTSFDVQYASKAEPSGFISKLDLAGDVVAPKWITGLRGPCGMGIHGDTLWVAERGHLTKVDIETGTIRTRHPVPASTFLNDVACDADGNVYVSDAYPTSPGKRVAVWRFADGKVEPWIEDASFSRTNGLYVHGDELLVGCSGDGTLRAVELATGRHRIVATLGGGVVDGIRVDDAGQYLVSLWHGPLFRVSPTGAVTELFDTGPEGWNAADFEYVARERMLIVPTFSANLVAAWELKR